LGAVVGVIRLIGDSFCIVVSAFPEYGINVKKVYIETTVFSFYYDVRRSPEVVAMRNWTRQWWKKCRPGYDVVTSTAVLAELERGHLAHRKRALRMAQALPAIAGNRETEEIVRFYVEHKVMPRDPLGDALHLALASIESCDYLLTWNCQHLANASKFGHIRRVNTILGLHVPFLVTPMELKEEET